MKRLDICCILVIVVLLNCSLAEAQVSSLESVTKNETHTFQLVPTNEGYLKSFSIQIASEGVIAGKLNCRTEGNVPANYNHLALILYQKAGTTLQTRDYANFKDEAAVSYDVTESGLNSGKEFVFTTRLNHAQAQCSCNLDITFTESVPVEKIGVKNMPIKKEAADTKKETAVPKVAPKRSPIPSIKP